jgi:lambda repressor-like predicted transcriptional regulator
MLGEIFRAATTLFLAETETARRLRAAIVTTLGGVTELQAGVAQFPIPTTAVGDGPKVAQTQPKRPYRPRKQAPQPAKAPSPEDWQAVAADIRAALEARGMSRQELARQVGSSKTSVAKAIGPQATPPGEVLRARLRTWLDDPPAADPLPPATRLLDGERERLSGYLSLGGDRHALREQFGIDRGILEAAAAGDVLAPAIVSRIRTSLSNGAG